MEPAHRSSFQGSRSKATEIRSAHSLYQSSKLASYVDDLFGQPSVFKYALMTGGCMSECTCTDLSAALSSSPSASRRHRKQCNRLTSYDRTRPDTHKSALTRSHSLSFSSSLSNNHTPHAHTQNASADQTDPDSRPAGMWTESQSGASTTFLRSSFCAECRSAIRCAAQRDAIMPYVSRHVPEDCTQSMPLMGNLRVYPGSHFLIGYFISFSPSLSLSLSLDICFSCTLIPSAPQ